MIYLYSNDSDNSFYIHSDGFSICNGTDLSNISSIYITSNNTSGLFLNNLLEIKLDTYYMYFTNDKPDNILDYPQIYINNS